MTKGVAPIAHEVFPGAAADVRSFAQVVSSLKERFPIGRVIVVSPVSEENLKPPGFPTSWRRELSAGEVAL